MLIQVAKITELQAKLDKIICEIAVSRPIKHLVYAIKPVL
jgi:hypothetical protein